MPLSTSSSRAPAGAWLKTLFLAGLAFLILLLGLEIGWRQMGFAPVSYTDDMRLWSLQREKLSIGDTSKTVALLGTSRMQIDFSSRAFAAHAPGYSLVRLGVLASSPYAVLRDLAAEKNFKGTVLVDVTVGALRRQPQDQQVYVDFYHREWNLNQRVNRWIQSLLESRLVMLDQRLNPKDFLRGLRGRAEQPYITVQQDRGHLADYRLIPAQAAAQLKRRSRKPEKVVTSFSKSQQQAWLKKVRRLEPYVKAIQERGGRVVFVHLPLSEEVWRWQAAKKAAYWDLFAKETAATTIHFMDYDNLKFETPDGSHLDYRDAYDFTRNIINILSLK